MGNKGEQDDKKKTSPLKRKKEKSTLKLCPVCQQGDIGRESRSRGEAHAGGGG